MKVKEICTALERISPLPLQEGWDNSGLQVGLTEAEVSGALLCLDVNEAIIDEALRRDCNLIVAHHPLLFHGLKVISDSDAVQRTVRKAICNNVNIVAMHTNMDNVRGGVNFKIAEKLGLEEVDFIASKIVNGVECGSGVIGTLPTELTSRAFIDFVKERFGVECAECNELLQRKVKRVAICGGAGDFLIDEAVRAKADAFITGEMHYHVYFGREQQIQICVIGHYQSEKYTSEIFKSIIGEACPEVKTYIAETNTNPIIYV